MADTWQLKVFNIQYLYKPKIKNKRSVKNTISLYWNKHYSFLVERFTKTHVNVNSLNVTTIMKNTYIKDSFVGATTTTTTTGPISISSTSTTSATTFDNWPSLIANSGTTLKDVNGNKIEIANYNWSTSQAFCELMDDGLYKTSIYITGRQKYWSWTGLKYKEEKVERIFNTL